MYTLGMFTNKHSFLSAALCVVLIVAASEASGENLRSASYTHITPGGNRLTGLKAALPALLKPLDIPLKEKPSWVLGMGEFWAVVLEDGTTQAFTVRDGKAREAEVRAEGVKAEAPPVLIKTVHGYKLVSTGLTSPALLPDGRVLKLDDDTISKSVIPRSPNPLKDTRILSDKDGRVLILTGPTSSYGHAVLGDGFEARGFMLIGEKGFGQEAIVSSGVIEGTSAIWVDLDGDSVREVLVTKSNAWEGARLEAFDEMGSLKAAGPAIGSGYRWLHQLAVAPFGPDGELEIATIRTPHIGGTVEFYRMEGRQLRITARLRGYSSHTIGSRNLDMALAGDLDSDGQVELLVPTRNMGALAGLRRVGAGVVEAWRLDLPGTLLTNIAVSEIGGKAAIGVGTDKKILRIWLP